MFPFAGKAPLRPRECRQAFDAKNVLDCDRQPLQWTKIRASLESSICRRCLIDRTDIIPGLVAVQGRLMSLVSLSTMLQQLEGRNRPLSQSFH